MTENVAQRDPVEQLAEEFMARLRRGEHPALSEYTAVHPDLADEIRDLFPALVMMEQIKPAGTEPHAPTADAVPEQLGDYRILREVARGGMGVVYEAEQVALGRHVALKVLPAQSDGSPLRLLRFRREARSAARLHHTNIVPVFDVGSTDGVHYYAMQFIHGVGLDEVLQEVRRLRSGGRSTDAPEGDLTVSLASGLRTGVFAGAPFVPVPKSPALPSEPSSILTGPAAHYVPSVARLGLQAADALAYAHGQRVLHRDVKPSNLLLDRQGTLWLTDFGLAKDDTDDLTRTGDIIGTVRYMAPERFRGVSDPRTDVYALGVTLYEMLTFRPAFPEQDRVLLVQQITQSDPPRPRALDPALPRDLETIVLKAIEREPGRRYSTAAEMAEDLRRFLSDRPVLARRASLWEQTWRWCRRNRGPAAAAATAFLLLSGGIAGTTVGLLSAERARQAEADHRRAAERERDAKEAARAEAVANLLKAREVTDRFLTRVSEGHLLGVPQMEPVRRLLLQDALEFYQGFLQQQGDDPALRKETALAYFRYGSVCVMLGRHAEARSALRRCLTWLEALSAEGQLTPENRWQLVDCYLALAGVLHPRDPQRAHAFEQAVRLSEALAAEFPKDLRVRRRLVYIRLGWSAELCRTRPDEARGLCRNALAAAEGAGGDPLQLAAAWRHWGTLQLQARQGPAAEQALRRALTIIEQEARESPSARAQYLLAVTLIDLAKILTDTRRFDEAEVAIRRALEISQKHAAGSPEVLNYREHLAVAHWRMATVLQRTGRGREAEASCREALARYEQLAADYRAGTSDLALVLGTPDGGFHGIARGWAGGEALAVTFSAESPIIQLRVMLAALLEADGRGDEGEQAIRELYARLETLEREFSDPQHRYDLAQLHAIAALNFKVARRYGLAEKPCRRALALYGELRAAAPEEAEYIEREAGEHFRLGDILAALDRTRESAQSYDRAAPLYGKLVTAAGPRKADFRHAQSSARNNAAWVLVTAPDPASNRPAEAIEAATEATTLEPTNSGYWNTLGIARYRAGDHTGAIVALEKSMDLGKGGDAFDRFFMAMARWQLGEKEKAREWHKRAVEECEKRPPKDPTAVADLRRVRTEADALITAARAAKP